MYCAMNPLSFYWLGTLDIAFLYALLFIFFSLLAITIFVFLVISLNKIKKKIKDVNYDLNPYILKLKKNIFLFGAILSLIASIFSAIYLIYIVLFPVFFKSI